MVTSLAAMFLLVGLQAKQPEWSLAVGGLEGRIEFKSGKFMSDTVQINPYLILHNTGQGAVNIWLAENFDNVKLELVDANGVPIAQHPIAHRGAVPSAFYMDLPRDATIRLNTTTGGMEVDKDAQMLIFTGTMGLTLPKGFTGDAYVTGTYTVSLAEGGKHWTGSLNLPKVKIWHSGNPVVTPPLPDGWRIHL